MSKLSFRARALDASKPMPIYLAEELPDLPDYSAINRAVPQMPSGMEKEEESEHHLQKAISGTGLIIPTPEVCTVNDLEFYERCYPPDYKMPKQHIHMQPLWEEQEAPEYDIDTEDERWLKQQRHPELTELKFEQMMDKLEKSSGQTVVTLNEAKLLLERNDDLIIAVYDYWLNKRLNTQHALILSVKTENRPGQSSNNPYLAFRRRTEKMQTRKNRKNDESSYEKMLKLRRDLARALTLLELVARRESAKRELVRLTALIAERRYAAGDFANQLLPEPPPRAAYTAVSIPASNFRREAYPAPHYPPRHPPTPVDQPRQRERRPYKRRKHRHPAPSSVQGLRDSGVYTSSEEESVRAEPPEPVDDGPFAFRRKPGCYYEMPTTTLYGDPVDPENPSKDGLFEHEVDPRHRYTLASLRSGCVGFARRRVARGGRVALDRTRTALDDLLRDLPYCTRGHSQYAAERQEEVDFETKAHRTPKELSRDYHTSGKYPWRHAFRRHLSRHPDLWIAEDIKPEPSDGAGDAEELTIKMSAGSPLPDVIQDSVKSDISFSARTIDGLVKDNLDSVMRKRAYSGCSDSSYDSEESLQPVEREFEQFINEVNKKWLHFRPKTPPPSPPPTEVMEDSFPCTRDTPLCVELHADGPEPFLTQLALKDLGPEPGDCRLFHALDTALSPLSEGDTSESFLSAGRSAGGRADSGPVRGKVDSFGCTVVNVTGAASEPIYLDTVKREPPPVKRETPKVKEEKVDTTPVPPSNIIVEEVNEVPQIKIERRRKEDTIEEVQLAHGVQLKTVSTKQSPLKKHIITSGARRVPDEPPHLVTVAVSDSLKVRLQNHLLSTQSGVLVQNGPFPPVVAVPMQQTNSTGTVSASSSAASSSGASTSSGRRVSAPLVQLAGSSLHKHVHVSAPLVVPGLAHVQPSKLKVLHAHPLSQSARTQLLQHRALGLPAVVSLAALDKPALLKAQPQAVAQLFEIKQGQLANKTHLVNVVTDDKRRLNVHVDGRGVVRALGGVRAPALRQQLALKQRLGAPAPRLVAGLVTAGVPLPRHKLSLSGAAPNVQAIAFAAPAHLKARHARVLPRAPAPPPPAPPGPDAVT